MSTAVLILFLLGLQVDHAMYAENLNGDFRYCISEISHPYINGDTKVCLYFNKSFNEVPDVRVCVPTICTREYDEYYVDTVDHEYVCIWFWNHQLKTMKLSFNVFVGDDLIEIKE